MPSPSTSKIPSLGPRTAVLLLSMGVVLVTAFAVSVSVSDHLRQTAIDEAARAADSIVVASMGTETIAAALADPSGASASGVDSHLAELVHAGQILRIKVWTPDGHIAFSDLPALIGKEFDVDDDLGDALAGATSTSFTDGTDAENEFERGLAARFLSIYLPIRNTAGQVVGAYEMYEDAAPIEADVSATQRDVFLSSARWRGAVRPDLLRLRRLVAAARAAEPAAARPGRDRAAAVHGPAAQRGAIPLAGPELRST